MSNVVKHARAQSCEVSLGRLVGHLLVSVRDDGRGFDPSAARGLGLTGMADRLDTIGGRLEVRSGPGSGTLLRREIPVVPEARDA